jgi:hypothetical protein
MPISARDESQRRLSSRGSRRRLIPEGSRRWPDSGGSRSASRLWSGRRELELAQGVEGPLADLAGDGESRRGRVAALPGRAVEGKVRMACSMGVYGGFHERPTQMRRAGLRELAPAAALTRLLDHRVEAGETGDLLGTAEATRLADLGQQVAGEDGSDPVDRLQRLAALVSAGEATELGVHRLQLCFERRHHRDQGVDLQARVRG